MRRDDGGHEFRTFDQGACRSPRGAGKCTWPSSGRQPRRAGRSPLYTPRRGRGAKASGSVRPEARGWWWPWLRGRAEGQDRCCGPRRRQGRWTGLVPTRPLSSRPRRRQKIARICVVRSRLSHPRAGVAHCPPSQRRALSRSRTWPGSDEARLVYTFAAEALCQMWSALGDHRFEARIAWSESSDWSPGWT